METIYVFNPIWQTVLKDLIKVELEGPSHYLVAFSFKTIIHLSSGLLIRLPKVLFFDYWIMWILHITQLLLKLLLYNWKYFLPNEKIEIIYFL